MLTFECFKGLPLEYELFLVEKYDSYKTTCRYIEIYLSNCYINYILVFDDNKLIDVLLFESKENSCLLLNSLVGIAPEIIEGCTRSIFEKHPQIKKVIIPASYNCYTIRKSFLISKTDDHILHLPTSMDEYYSQLSSKMRKNIKSCYSKFTKDYPQAVFKVFCKSDISRDMVERIIHLNMDRMKQKGVIPGRNDADVIQIHHYAQYYGCVTCIELDGVIVAGNISYIMNKRIFGFVTAHDNNYSAYNLGRMCRMKVIENSISKGLSAYHLLWGNSEYKVKLKAVPTPLYSFEIHKSYSIEYIINSTKAAVAGLFLRLKQSELAKPLRNVIKACRVKKTALEQKPN